MLRSCEVKMCLSLIVFSLLVSIARGEEVEGRPFQLIINEINADSPKSRNGKFDFIELKSFLNGEASSVQMENLQLYGITTSTSDSKDAWIELVIDLSGFSTNRKGFFSVGGLGVTNKGVIPVTNECVKFRERFVPHNKNNRWNFLNTGSSDYLKALIIVEAGNEERLTLSEKNPSIKITANLKQFIASKLIDIVVYGYRAPYDKCNLFEELCPQLINRKYVLREIDAQKNDYSLNRCTPVTIAIVPERFKLGTPTPAKDNDCSGAHYIFEDHMIEVQTLLPQMEGHDADPGYYQQVEYWNTTSQCSGYYPSSSYHSTTQILMEQSVQDAMLGSANDVCTEQMLMPNGLETVQSLYQANDKRQQIGAIGTDYSIDYEWSTEKYFK